MSSSNYDVIVIGAGLNGLTTATILAKKGRKVLVVDARKVAGGLAASEEFHPGFHSAGILHDTTGLRSWVVSELQLEKFGLSRRAGSVPVFAPESRGAGHGLLIWPDAKRFEEELLPLGGQEVKSYAAYRDFIRRMTPVLRSVFDDMPPDIAGMSFPGLWDLGKKALSLRLLGKADMMEIMRVTPMCVADWLNEWFSSDLLKAALAGPSIYNSYTGPWSPGTNANLLMAEALAEAPVVGGAASVAAAMEKAAIAAGVEFRLGQAVRQLCLEGAKITGISLVGGEMLTTGLVAASCHPQRVFLDLMPPEYLEHKFEQSIRQVRSRGTMAKIHLALRDYPSFTCRPGLKAEYIRTGESLDELERAFDPVKYRQSSQAPVLDMYVPTLENPALAPAGQHVLSIQSHFVATTPDDGGWTAAAREKVYQSAISQLERYVPQIRELIVGHQILTPADLQAEFGLPGGHVLHGEHSADQLLVRPIPQCSRYATPYVGLYLCGGGSHPGGGVSGAPGALAAKTILARR